MSVYYDGKHSIDFFRLDGGERVGKNSWTDFHLIPAKKPTIAPKQPTSGMVGFPNSNRRIYFPKLLPEKQTYGLRSGEWEFYIDNESFSVDASTGDLSVQELREAIVNTLALAGNWLWDTFDFNLMTIDDGVRQYAEGSTIFLESLINFHGDSNIPVIGRSGGSKLVDRGVVFQRTRNLRYIVCVVEDVGETAMKTLIENRFNIDFEKSEYPEADYYCGILNIPADDKRVWTVAYKTLVNYFHGIKMAVRLNDYLEDGKWDKFYTGRITVSGYSTDDKFTTITLHYDFESGVVDDISSLDLKYDVFWYDYDGTLLRHDKVPIGSVPSYDDGDDYDTTPAPSSAQSSQNYKVVDNTDGNLIERTYSVYENSEVTYIPSYAFYMYSNLTKASFPNCSSIGDYAFYGCSRLNLYLMSNAVVNMEATTAMYNVRRIYVPVILLSNYKTHSVWSYVSNRIYSYSE